MYNDNSTNNNYPKTLVIRNSIDGMIWQVYHVDNDLQAHFLAKNAKNNGFYGRTLEDYRDDMEETFPNWKIETAKEFVKLLPDHLLIKEGCEQIINQ